MTKSTSRNIPLTSEEIRYFYDLLDESLTPYDCGKLCAPKNGGEPLCCSVENAVPMLYREEFAYLAKRTELWARWKPKTDVDKKMKKEDETKLLVFCECKGIAHCERENRSICCRTFPLEPYIDAQGKFIGLIFMKEFRGKCPLQTRLKDIKQSVVDKHFQFWTLLFEKKSDEYDLYKGTSRGWRISAAKTGQQLPILYPAAVSA